MDDFFKYFKSTWCKKINISEWNLYNIALEAYNKNFIDKLFFTNNIVESCNSRLNVDIKKNKNNTINQFGIEINKIINLFFTAGKYKPPIFTKAKAISKYFIVDNKFSQEIHLIDNKTLKNIFINYKNQYILNNNINELIEFIEDSFSLSFSSDNELNIINNNSLNNDENIKDKIINDDNINNLQKDKYKNINDINL